MPQLDPLRVDTCHDAIKKHGMPLKQPHSARDEVSSQSPAVTSSSCCDTIDVSMAAELRIYFAVELWQETNISGAH
jgi:hypothetical protein